jgi:hypothetical protein
MDFIERIFHVSPDGGSGLLEIAILLVLVAVPAAAVLFRAIRKSRTETLGS